MDSLQNLDSDALAERLLVSVGTSTWPPVHTAVEWAKEKHHGQLRRDGSDFPCHPLRVAVILHEFCGQNDANVLCTALLHDLLEDTEVDYDDIAEVFGNKVADEVRSLTLQEPRDGQSKYDRNISHFETLRWEGRDVQIVRSADRLDNIMTLPEAEVYPRRDEFLRETREGLLPLTLAVNTTLYHALDGALAAAGCPA